MGIGSNTIFFSLFAPIFITHQLSFIVRIVPSPDWFVGVDSLNLCEGTKWKNNITTDLYPYDAGTDSGFTFSSPNFETIPQDKVTQVRRCRSIKYWFYRPTWLPILPPHGRLNFSLKILLAVQPSHRLHLPFLFPVLKKMTYILLHTT